MKFTDIELDSNTECILNDHVMVFDYYNQIVGTPQCKLARKTAWTVTGRRHLTVYFNTNDVNEGKGFKLEYYESPDPEKQHVIAAQMARTCSDKWRLEARPKVQQLTSPGWPLKYPLNTACFWRIKAPTELHIVHFQFKNILMEDPNEDGDCIYDYVKVYKGQNDYIEENLLSTQCGTKTTTSLTEVYKSNQGESMYVKFQSDNRNNGRGFSAYYLASKTTDLRPKPTLSPSMKRWVLENEKTQPAKVGSSVGGNVPSVGGGPAKKTKKNKKKKTKLQRTRLWDISERDILKAEKIHEEKKSKIKYW